MVHFHTKPHITPVVHYYMKTKQKILASPPSHSHSTKVLL